MSAVRKVRQNTGFPPSLTWNWPSLAYDIGTESVARKSVGLSSKGESGVDRIVLTCLRKSQEIPSRSISSRCLSYWKKLRAVRPALSWQSILALSSSIGANEIWAQWWLFSDAKAEWRIRHPFVLPSRYPPSVTFLGRLSYAFLHSILDVKLLYLKVSAQCDSMTSQT